MSNLLNIPTQQPFDGNPYTVAAGYLEKIFHLIPAYDGFQLSDIIDSSSLTLSEKIIASNVSSKMEHILKSEGCLETHSYYGNLVLQLNSHGRDVLSAGGLTLYKNQKKKGETNLQVKIQTVNTIQKDSESRVAKIGKYITNHLVHAIIALIVAYLIFRFGWT